MPAPSSCRALIALIALTVVAASFAAPLAAQPPKSIPAAPPRPAGEGEGPFRRLILRGGTLVNGAGAPANGPVDIVIEGNRVVAIESVGYPGLPIDPDKRPKLESGDREIDVTGHTILPGFVDLHGHIGGVEQGTPAEYVYKLWLAHGVTTVRDPGSGNGIDWVLAQKKASAANEITAPRLLAYSFFGQGLERPIVTPDEARAWVRDLAKKGGDGIKFFNFSPPVMQAALGEAQKLGLRTTAHHAQTSVARANVLDTARWGLDCMEHWYGLPEALFTERRIQDYPLDYNYANEQDRFGEAGRLWRQAAAPGSERWNETIRELISLDFTLDPTLNIYEASRDLMRAYRQEWHEDYTLPSLWAFYAPSRASHGSYWFDWSTQHEIDWKENYRLWMRFLDDYKNRGGRVTVGTDSGFIYQLYGFAYVREMELLQEAGFHPLEVIRAATLSGAEALGVADRVGSIEPGKLADLVVVEGNPLANLKLLYGSGALVIDANNKPVRSGGVRWTIKDGIVYDAKKLLADVKAMVVAAKKEAGVFRLVPPGWPASGN
jgi:imidazolonepropionase-like amidohydrolase